jgi:hypothetical protein
MEKLLPVCFCPAMAMVGVGKSAHRKPDRENYNVNKNNKIKEVINNLNQEFRPA